MLTIIHSKKFNVTIAYPEKNLPDNIEKTAKSILSEIKIIKPRSLEELKTLFPVKQPGLVVDLTEI